MKTIFIKRRSIVAAAFGGFLIFGIASGDSLSPHQELEAKRIGPVTTDAEIIAALNLDMPGLEKVKTAVQAGDISAAKAAYLDYRRTASPAKWQIMPSEEPATPVETDDPAADAICEHLIPNNTQLKYPKATDMGRDFDWYYNPLPKTDPNYSQSFTWQVIGRTEFWTQLANAYWSTHDEKYAAEWVNEMEDFVAKVPLPPASENTGLADPPSIWRGLEVSVRMYESWPYAYFHFLNSPSFTPDAQWIYLKSVYEHGAFLARELKNNPNGTGNHLTSSCEGLYAVGVLFPELQAAEGWRTQALDELTSVVSRMIYPDGMSDELTPGYHMGVLSECLAPLQLAKLNNLPFPDALREKIIAMYRAVILVMDQTGHDVPTNDSWDFDVRREVQHGLEFVDDPLMEWAASNGKKGEAPPASTMLPYAGFYAMRSGWKLDDLFLFFRAGPAGQGHEHEDMLQVDLNAWGKKLLFDAGRFAYDQSIWRYYNIGTSSHNTITVDGKWQHRGQTLILNGVWQNYKPPGVPHPVSNPWVSTPLFDFVSGTYPPLADLTVASTSK